MKTYIAICSCRDWKPQFGKSLCALVQRCPEVFLNVLQGTSVLPRARQLAIEDAINGGFSHFLMIDDDMKFDQNLLLDLLSRNLPVVGVNYVRKDPANPSPMSCGLDGAVVSSKGKTGVEEIGWIGFGAILIRLEDIKNIARPLFEMRWLDERQDFMGEDYYFSMKARTAGIPIYVDHDASNKCSHIGDFNFREAA